MKILIGFDGSVDAEGALHDLELAGLPAKAEVLVATFIIPSLPLALESQTPLGYIPPDGKYRKASLQEALQIAEKGAAYLGKRFPQWKVKAQAAIEDPAPGLLRMAEKWKPDLVVLGSHGQTALKRLLMGSVSQRVLHHAKVDVRITRPRIRVQEGPPRILIGVDGSRDSFAAVLAVAGRAWPRKTEVRLVGVLRTSLKPFEMLIGGISSNEKNLVSVWRTHLEKSLSRAVQRLALAGLDAEPALLTGDPRTALVKDAKAWRADCIFIGSRGLNALERFLVGSISSTVASHAPCTVEVVRKLRVAGKKK